MHAYIHTDYTYKNTYIHALLENIITEPHAHDISANMHTCIHTYMHTYTQCMCLYMYVCMYVCMYIRIYNNL